MDSMGLSSLHAFKEGGGCEFKNLVTSVKDVLVASPTKNTSYFNSIIISI